MPKTKAKSKIKSKTQSRSRRSRKKYVYAVGRRKTASARVRLFQGKGENLINEKPLKDYFPGKISEIAFFKPFELTETKGKYFVTAKVVGAGKSAQLGAVIHGIARALEKENRDKFRPLLKSAGLLKRDPRAKERRKPGYAQSARAKKQSPKR